MIGVKIGTWMLEAELGRGTWGTVYRATSEDGTRQAALKMLTHESTRFPEFQARFIREMLALQRLDHPNIAKYYESGVHAGTAFYASELIVGTDCATQLRTAPRTDELGLGWKECVLSIAVQASRALKHGHHRSILHRSIKPANCILMPNGVVKLTDFGVGKIVNIAPLTLPAEPFGSAAFLAPEFFNGKPITRRSDFYSLGCTLYTLLTGRPPFTAASASEYMHKHCYVLPDRPNQFLPKLPHDFDDLICALIAKDPNRRPTTAVEIIEALDAIRGKCERKGEIVAWPSADGDTTGPMPALADIPDHAEELPRPLMRRPAVVIPLFLGLIALVLALGFWPRPSAEELFAKAQPLLQSENPDDWDRAWDDYLQPLSERYPNKYTEELRALRVELRDRKRLRSSIAEGVKLKPQSDEERRYLRAMALAQSGHLGEARTIWNELKQAPEPKSRWAKLAQDAISELDRRGIPATEPK